MNTGALGHGLPICIGMALAAKMDDAPYRVFTLLGDGELAEGSNWEAGLAAAHYKLDNLVAILDHNTLQITGHTRDVMSNEPLDEKWRAFGWTVRTRERPRLRRTDQGADRSARAGQAHVHHRQHDQGQRRELHGERRQMASRRAERSGIETGAGRTRCGGSEIEGGRQ